MHSNRPYKSNIDYKVYWEKSTKETQVTMFINTLQKTTKVRHELQSLLIDYKRLQKSD